jgi:hypothetical protein
MSRYIVELTSRLYYEMEVEAEDEEMAVEKALDRADEDIRDDAIEWDVDFVECIDCVDEE